MRRRSETSSHKLSVGEGVGVMGAPEIFIVNGGGGLGWRQSWKSESTTLKPHTHTHTHTHTQHARTHHTHTHTHTHASTQACRHARTHTHTLHHLSPSDVAVCACFCCFCCFVLSLAFEFEFCLFDCTLKKSSLPALFAVYFYLF